MMIRTVVLAIVCALSALLLGESGVAAYRAWDKRQEAATFLAVNRMAEHLLESAGSWAVERGATNAALNVADVAAEQRDTIAKRRSAADESFRAGLADLRSLAPSPAVQQAAAEAESAFGRLTSMRVEIDRSLGLALAERPAALIAGFVPSITELIDKSSRLRLVAEIVAEAPEARLGRLTQLRHLVSQMAEYAGRERAAIAGLVAAHKPLGSDALRTLLQNRGRVELAWSIVQAVRARADAPASLLAAIAAVETQFFGTFEKTREAVYAGAPTAAYPIDAKAWFAEATAAIDTLLGLGREMGDIARTAAADTSARSQSALLVSLAMLVICGGLAAFSFWTINRRVTAPMRAMTRAMLRLAEGDKDIELPATVRADEIGAMATAVQVFKDNAIAIDRMQSEQEVQARQAQREKRQALETLAGRFEATVQSVVGSVSAAAEQMRGTAEAMAGSADETNRQATIVANAAEEASANVETVATAAEELSASISEISRRVAQASTISGRAAEESRHTDETVAGLAEAAQKIGDVVALINDIASQTNLLALNATIEAARAGDAGKGFAVVASEVKSLATQTARATEDIASQIGAIQAKSAAAVAAIQHIAGTIAELDGIATAIAGAVEEQGAATQEIARNIQQAASGTGEVSATIGSVSAAAGKTGVAAGQVLDSAGELTSQSGLLRGEVEKFLATLRAA